MNAHPNYLSIISLIGDPTRAAMLDALLGGQALPAGELAYISGVTPQTASSHLTKLVDANVLSVEVHGRHRYYRLSSPEVAHLLEAASAIAPPPKIKSLRQSEELKKVRHARTCYDHLAGSLGVAFTNALLSNGFICIATETEFAVTEIGVKTFHSIGVDIASLKRGRRVFAKRCLDWSERFHHLGGLLGATLTTAMFDNNWIDRMEGTRAVSITEKGKKGFREIFAVPVDFLN